MILYKYGMRLRGFSPWCQPDGHYRWEDGDRKYHSFLFYRRKLTDKETRDYELDFIGEVEE